MTTLNDLKKWPRLFELACAYTGPDARTMGDWEVQDLFEWSETPEGNDFWEALDEGEFDKARALRPELFEEAPMEFIPGRKYRLVKDDGYERASDAQEGDIFVFSHCGNWVDDFISCKNGKIVPFLSGCAIFEPIPEQEEAQEYYKKTPEGAKYWNAMDAALKEMCSNAAMLTRDGPEEVKPEPEVKPNPHSEALARALKAVPFEIVKFSPRGM